MQCWTIFHFCPSPSVWLELDSPSDASLQSSGIFSCSVSVQCLRSVCWLLWRWGCVFVSSSSACCVLPAELRPGGRFGWRGVAPVELWMEVKRGWGLASGGHTPLHPKHFRLSPTPLPHPLLSLLLPSLPKQSPSTRGVRLDEGDWRCVSLSFCLSALLFFFLSLHSRPYLSLPLLPRFLLGKSEWERSVQPELVCRCWENETKTYSILIFFLCKSSRIRLKTLFLAFIWLLFHLKTWKMYCEEVWLINIRFINTKKMLYELKHSECLVCVCFITVK